MAMVEQQERGRRGVFFRSIVAAGGFAIVLLLLGTFFHGKTGFEKTAIRLVTPLGAMWVLLAGWAAQALVRKAWREFGLASAIWIVVTLGCSGPLASISTRYLESRVEPAALSVEQPFDYVVVLGGGTGLAPGRAQLASSGDRVLYGAQLYYGGYTKKLITTGEAIESIGGAYRSGPAEQTVEIWTKLGIPRDDILTLPGINTYLETQALAEAMQGELSGKRVGLLTSATHLPRAVRLAKSHGIKQIFPLAADYRAKGNPYYTFMDFLPNPGALDQLYRNQHEFMAWFVGR